MGNLEPHEFPQVWQISQTKHFKGFPVNDGGAPFGILLLLLLLLVLLLMLRVPFGVPLYGVANLEGGMPVAGRFQKALP